MPAATRAWVNEDPARPVSPSPHARLVWKSRPRLAASPHTAPRGPRFSIRCSTVIMLELRSFHTYAAHQRNLSAYRNGVMFKDSWQIKDFSDLSSMLK
ncbi:hypothetical protein NN561_009134 [Cricetulus griseus]